MKDRMTTRDTGMNDSRDSINNKSRTRNSSMTSNSSSNSSSSPKNKSGQSPERAATSSFGAPARNGNGAPARNGNGKPPKNGNGRPARNGNGKPAGNGNGQSARRPEGTGIGSSARNGNGKPARNGNGQPPRRPDGIGIGSSARNGNGQPTRNGNGQSPRRPDGTGIGSSARNGNGQPTRNGNGQPPRRPNGSNAGTPARGSNGRPVRRPSDSRPETQVRDANGRPVRRPNESRPGAPARDANGRPVRKPGTNSNSQGRRVSGSRIPSDKSKSRNGKPGGGGVPKFSKTATKRKKKTTKRNLAKTIIGCMAAVFFICMAGGVLYVYSVLKTVPPVTPETISEQLKKSSTIYDDAGNPIDNIYLGDGSRTTVEYKQFPKNLTNAFIAIEDKTFWTHHGFNFVRIGGAIKDALVGGDKRVSGTSTITQQLARNIWLEDSKSKRDMDRKLKEAYYSVQIERKLKKSVILTNYLNAIWLGNHSFGVQAAAQSYFQKDIEDLDLIECAALASLPKSPTELSMISIVNQDSVDKDDPNILLEGKMYTYLYNGAVENRVKLVLKNMFDQKLITRAEYDAALAENLRDHIKPSEPKGDSNVAFFVDYAIQDVAKGLMEQYPDRAVDMKTAVEMVYVGGYEIHTSMDPEMQSIIAKEFKDNSNYPNIVGIKKNSDGDAIDDKKNVVLFKHSNLFNGKGNFWFTKKEAKIQDDGSLIIYKNNRMNFFQTEVDGTSDVSIEFKDIFGNDKNGEIYIIKGGYVNVPLGEKTLDDQGNCIISAKFMKEKPDFFLTDDGKVGIPKSSYTLNQRVIQPQSAMVILENRTGIIKAMVGGRNVKGEKNFNRALSPRQPGSSIKPIAVYGAAIEMSANGEPVSNGEKSFGKYWSPMSVIRDEKLNYGGRVWPKNVDNAYKGAMTFRHALEQSRNVTSVKVQLSIGTEHSVNMVKNCGITSLVEDGKVNDMNPAALALGGMTRGVSPLEMASAYSAFANKGVRMTPIAYTEVTRKDGTIVLDGSTDKNKCMDKGTAFIMNDILRTAVTHGPVNHVKISGIPVAAKTGTTSDKYDAWLVGNTPYYSAALWIGNDVNMELSEGSAAAQRLWQKIMSQAIGDKKAGTFPGQPKNVVRYSVGGISDFCIKGTAPKSISLGNKSVTICKDSGDLATKWCTNTEKQSFNQLEGGSAPPKYYCNLHNKNPGANPINPKKKLKDTTEDEPKEKPKPKPKPKPQPPSSGSTGTSGAITRP